MPESLVKIPLPVTEIRKFARGTFFYGSPCTFMYIHSMILSSVGHVPDMIENN